jgi:elongation factor P
MPLTDQPVKGMYILEEGRVFHLLDRKLKTQGRQGGLIVMKKKALDNGQVLTETVKAGTKIEYIIPETKEVQFLYSDNTGSFFMDSQTYESVKIPKEIVGNYVNFLKEGSTHLVMLYNEKVLAIRENPTVDLKVISAPDAVKGNTSSGGTKEVKVETGYRLQTPMFIKKGDVVRINTETGEYSGKAN